MSTPGGGPDPSPGAVWVVSQGEYSSRCIMGVYADQVAADVFAEGLEDADVQEWATDGSRPESAAGVWYADCYWSAQDGWTNTETGFNPWDTSIAPAQVIEASPKWVSVLGLDRAVVLKVSQDEMARQDAIRAGLT